MFAGPGGLNEGFSRLQGPGGQPIFDIAASFEMDPHAVATLRLRAAARAEHMSGDYLRVLAAGQSPEAFVAARPEAADHVHQIVLGPDTREESDAIIRNAIGSGDDPWVLIGGPPCQAYSLAGRSRRVNDPTFDDDHKHFLFREYLHIIESFRPAVFVMENVKGLLSATNRGTQMFDRIRQDLSCGGTYEIRSFVTADSDPSPRDFVIRSELYGIPQRRHRVILLGIRSDAGTRRPVPLEPVDHPTTLDEALHGLRAVRSRVSPLSRDSVDDWLAARREGWALARQEAGAEGIVDLSCGAPPEATQLQSYRGDRPPTELQQWLRPAGLDHVWQHEPRSHMHMDLVRYVYLSALATAGMRPRLGELPPSLIPDHRNARRPDAPFVDRFKVQVHDEPSSTIVSHISKDGHHYIHPDPNQMRSLTVREAARLQTFPDDYIFLGSRTQQYHQVGNAVPPLLARKLARVVAGMLHAEV